MHITAKIFCTPTFPAGLQFSIRFIELTDVDIYFPLELVHLHKSVPVEQPWWFFICLRAWSIWLGLFRRWTNLPGAHNFMSSECFTLNPSNQFSTTRRICDLFICIIPTLTHLTAIKIIVFWDDTMHSMVERPHIKVPYRQGKQLALKHSHLSTKPHFMTS